MILAKKLCAIIQQFGVISLKNGLFEILEADFCECVKLFYSLIEI